MQERITAHFGLSLGEMLRIGENLIAGRVVFPWQDQLDGLPRDKQVPRIMSPANEQVGHPQDNIHFIKMVIKFLNGGVQPAELYAEYLRLIRSRMK